MVSVLVDEQMLQVHVLQNFATRHGPWLQRVDSTLILHISSRVIVMSRGSKAPVETDLKGWNLTRCMTSQGFGSVTMRWYNINVQQKSLSWITFDYTAHLHTTVRVRWEYHLNDFLMRITMSCVFDTVFLAWDSLRVILLLGVFRKKIKRSSSIRPSEFILLYLVVFGVIYLSCWCSCYQASRLSQVTKVDSKKLQKQISRMYPGCDPCYVFFATTSH